jgi:sec-independent protein translocase protein TatB
MFDIGWSELLVVAVVAIIFIGPRELIPMLRAFGKYAGKLKRMASEFQSQFNEALREVELDQIAKEVEEIRKISPVGDIEKELEAEMKPIGAAVGDIAKPIEAPAKSKAAAEGKAAAKTAGPKPEKAAAKPAKPKTRSAAKPAPKPASELAPKPAAKPAPKRAAGGDGS